MPQVHLDTIPIWDAYKQETECPLCAMETACERQFLDVALGGAMMEPDTRVATNEKGFCAEHFRKLYAMENKLSLALMTHTHLKDVIASAHKAAEPLRKAVDAERKKNPVARAAGGVTKSTPVHKQLEQLAAHVDGRMDSCFICERIETTMARYVETVCYLYKKDESFRKAFGESKGVCMRHYPLLLRGAGQHLSGTVQLDFLTALLDVQEKNLARMEHDLEWFTLKFDYRNQDKPWGESRDAVERTLNKLQGRVIPSADDDKPQTP